MKTLLVLAALLGSSSSEAATAICSYGLKGFYAQGFTRDGMTLGDCVAIFKEGAKNGSGEIDSEWIFEYIAYTTEPGTINPTDPKSVGHGISITGSVRDVVNGAGKLDYSEF